MINDNNIKCNLDDNKNINSMKNELVNFLNDLKQNN